MTSAVTCDECIHLLRDDINPATGLGWCQLRKVAKFPMEPHYCRQREEEVDAADQA